MQLLDAIMFATQAHRDQKDKNGKPYFDHCLRVFSNFVTLAEQLTLSKQEQRDLSVVAILHDVKEDCKDKVLLEEINSKLMPNQRRLLDRLTKKKDQSYPDYIANIAKDPFAAVIKVCDIEDNIDEKRLAELPEETQKRLRRKYKQAISILHSGLENQEYGEFYRNRFSFVFRPNSSNKIREVSEAADQPVIGLVDEFKGGIVAYVLPSSHDIIAEVFNIDGGNNQRNL